MKINYGLILATLFSTSVLAQDTTTAPPPAAPSTTAPAPTPPDANATKTKKTKKKTTVKKKATTPKPTAEATTPAPFTPNQSAEARQDNINVRGQARITGEVIGHLKKGETVTVLEEITLPHPKTDEPAKWAKIAMPESIHVWVNTSYLDSSNSTVKARKLNLRGGPGENYSVIGLLHKGDAVKTITTKGDWTEIEAAPGSFAFVAAHLLEPKESAPQPIVQNNQPTPIPITPTPTRVENPGNIATPTGENPGVPVTSAGVPPPAPVPVPAPAPGGDDQPAPKRVVEREGVVGGTVSIQSPSHYKLKNLDDGRTMDYLYTSSPNVDLSRYKGLTVLVTGEESLDERWPDTPVITIQKIQVVK